MQSQLRKLKESQSAATQRAANRTANEELSKLFTDVSKGQLSRTTGG